MIDNFFVYNNQVFKTGDSVTCDFWYGNPKISDAKIYVCSPSESQAITPVYRDFNPIVFICNNIIDHYTGAFISDRLGYKYRIVSGLEYKLFNDWSDGLRHLKKAYIKDQLAYPIDMMIIQNKLAINKGILKL
jgi:hypothetical protein